MTRWRLVGYKREGQVWLLSWTHRDHTRRFPTLAAAIAALAPPTLILDGEVRSPRGGARGADPAVHAPAVNPLKS
jgi:hypothetical protein